MLGLRNLKHHHPLATGLVILFLLGGPTFASLDDYPKCARPVLAALIAESSCADMRLGNYTIDQNCNQVFASNVTFIKALAKGTYEACNKSCLAVNETGATFISKVDGTKTPSALDLSEFIRAAAAKCSPKKHHGPSAGTICGIVFPIVTGALGIPGALVAINELKKKKRRRQQRAAQHNHCHDQTGPQQADAENNTPHSAGGTNNRPVEAHELQDTRKLSSGSSTSSSSGSKAATV